MKKIYRVQLNKNGAPNFSTAEEVRTEQVKYFDEDEKIWRIGSVIVEPSNTAFPNNCKNHCGKATEMVKDEPTTQTETQNSNLTFEMQTDCPWR